MDFIQFFHEIPVEMLKEVPTCLAKLALNEEL